MEHNVSPKANDTKETDCLASLCPITNTREFIVIYQQRGLIKVLLDGLPPESETIKSRDIANTEREGNSMMTTRSFRLIAAICLASIVALSQFDRVDGQASNKVEGESATASNNKDNVSRRRKGVASSASEEVDDEEKMEKIGEDIALLKLDDKIYWNRFLQSSGSMSESPSAAPTTEDGDDDDDDDDDDGEYM